MAHAIHEVDAFDAYEAAVARRQDAARRRVGRLGRKRQHARKAMEVAETAAQLAATLAMRELDAECQAMERVWRASDALRTYEAEQKIYQRSAALRKVATTAHLGETTPGLRGYKRWKELDKRVESFHQRTELAKAAADRINQAANVHAVKRTQISQANRVWWAHKLEAAVAAQNCTTIVHILENGGDPDFESWNGMTPLLCCIIQHRHDLLRRCLELGGDPNVETQDGKTALVVAIVADDLAAIQILLEPKWKCSPWNESKQGGVTALLVACEKGRLAAVQVLLAQPGSSSQIQKRNNAHGLTPLMQAAKGNHLSVARLLLRHNANPFVHCKANRSAADHARAYGHLRMERLVARGNEFNLDPSTPPTFEERNEIAALEALYRDLDRNLSDRSMDKVLDGLHDEGLISPSHESPVGHTAFLLACANGALSTVQLLMQRCLWTQTNRDGVTGLLEAASRGHFDVLLHLVSQGGNMNHRDFQGRDGFSRLHDGGHHEMLHYFLQYKASNNKASEQAWLPWWQLNPTPRAGPASSPSKSPSKPSLQPLPVASPVHSRPMCAQCVDRHAAKQCRSCDIPFCDQCYWRFHMDARRRHHEYDMLFPTACVVPPKEDHFRGWQELHVLLTREPAKAMNQELQAIRKQANATRDERHMATIEVKAAASALAIGGADEAALQLVAVYRDLGNFSQAIAGLRETEEMATPRLSWQIRRATAQVYLAQGKPADAVTMYFAALTARLNDVAVDHRDVQDLLDEFYCAMDNADMLDDAVTMAKSVRDLAVTTLPRRHSFVSTTTTRLDSLTLRREQRAMLAEDKATSTDQDRRTSLETCVALLRDANMVDIVTALGKQLHVSTTLGLWRDMQMFKLVERRSEAAKSTAARIVRAMPAVHCIPASMSSKVAEALQNAQWASPHDIVATSERVVVASLHQTMFLPFIQSGEGQRWLGKQSQSPFPSSIDG
ncbi:hypothetical protein, variant [Aphanomyces invadans]|uniref:Uncharacterized protein n=1 Tax=Aphanomyces invadans TaxID=157072 RepID=A0A024TNJ7_9STRA|nr:hypothetical protein, variant [Aphanomyces invadans]ETV95579.1 hypothetical protein, variant [Aphanomyces invadans]|eukprot:XP_008875772.1 hypothetical protein, variant [Aphanomyces invadans]